MADDRDDLEQRLAANAGKAVLKDAAEKAKAKVEQGGVPLKLKIIGGAVGLGVLAVLGVTLVAKLWAYAVAALVVGGAGLAGYVVVKPKVKAMKERAEARLLAGRREREAEEARRAAAEAEAARKKQVEAELAAKKQKLEDDLAALKAKR